MLGSVALTSTEAVLGGLIGLLGLMSALVVLGHGVLIVRRRALGARQAEARPCEPGGLAK